MEPTAAWVPCNFQLANWTMEPAAWSPGFPAESADQSTEIYGSSWIQTACVPSNNNSGGGPLVEYYASAGTQHCYPIEKKEALESLEVVVHDMEMDICTKGPIRVLEEEAHRFEDDINMIKEKIHRYPQRILDLGDWYTVPRIVAIGPYHHSRQQLVRAVEVKRVAAYHCVSESGRSVQELCAAVVLAADDARRLYDKDVMAGIGTDDFRLMMFFDACFLVQFMVWYTDVSADNETHPSLRSFFCCNSGEIYHDIWLLENQLPWSVVEAVMRFRHVDLNKFVGPWRNLLQDRQPLEERPFDLDHGYQPPHLLGLLRHHTVGSRKLPLPDLDDFDKFKSLPFSVSAIELAEMGITLTANGTAEVADMGVRKKGIFFAELTLAPLSLNYARASRVVNMAALELCTVPSFVDADRVEDSAVCSYLCLLSMLVNRKEDVHELRRKGVLQGGGGFTDKQALHFFTSLQSLPAGLCHTCTMVEIEIYRNNRRMQTKGHAFWYKKHHLLHYCFSCLYLRYTCRYLCKTQVSQGCPLIYS